MHNFPYETLGMVGFLSDISGNDLKSNQFNSIFFLKTTRVSLKRFVTNLCVLKDVIKTILIQIIAIFHVQKGLPPSNLT